MSIAAIACAEVDQNFSESVPIGSISQVYADLDRGHVSYAGTAGASEIAFNIRSWGRSGSKGRATANEEANEWGVSVLDSELTAWGRSPSKTSGVDFSFGGPDVMDVEIVTLEGNAELRAVDGSHVITADKITGTGIAGDADLYAARGGMNVEIYPDFGSLIVLQAIDGDVLVGLPFGLQYDLEVYGDWDYPMDVQDLGFDAVDMSPGYFTALTGGGNVVVQVFVESGGFYLYEAPPIASAVQTR